MPFLYEVTNTAQQGTIPMANVMHFQKTDGAQATLSQVQTLLGYIGGNFYSQLSSHFPVGVRWQAGTKVLEFEDSSPGVKTFIPASPVIASAPDGAEPLPSTCAVCINWHTGFPGRSQRGRTFLGPLVTEDLTDGKLNSTVTASIRAIAQGLIDNVKTLSPSWTLDLWSKKLGQAFEIHTASTDGVVDTLRSRKY